MTLARAEMERLAFAATIATWRALEAMPDATMLPAAMLPAATRARRATTAGPAMATRLVEIFARRETATLARVETTVTARALVAMPDATTLPAATLARPATTAGHATDALPVAPVPAIRRR